MKNALTDDVKAQQRYEFDAMAEMHSEERLEMQRFFAQERKTTHELYAKEKELLLEEKDRQAKHYTRIIMGLIISLVLLLGGIIGGAVYLFTSFDFGMATYQEFGSNSINYDGITLNNTTRK